MDKETIGETKTDLGFAILGYLASRTGRVWRVELLREYLDFQILLELDDFQASTGSIEMSASHHFATIVPYLEKVITLWDRTGKESERQRKIEELVNHIARLGPVYGFSRDDILVADHEFDEFIPEELTFIFPRGAVVIDPTWVPDFSHKDGVYELVNPPRLMFRMPDLTFRIDANGHVTGMGSQGNLVAMRLNGELCLGQAVGQEFKGLVSLIRDRGGYNDG